MVLRSRDVEEFLTGLAKLAAGRFSGAGTEVFAAVTLLRPRTAATVASSSEQAKMMDEVQYPFDDGPCLRAAREEQVYVVRDFRTDTRFGRYTEAIAGHGIFSALGIPIPLDGDANAGLDLYARAANHFSVGDIAEAELLAREASASLRMAVRIARLADTGEQLKEAMSSRTVIDVAAGIIMGQNRCSHDTAMTILKAASSGRNIKLNRVAAAVVESIGQQIPITHFDG
jgi:GAF domain-containing protein